MTFDWDIQRFEALSSTQDTLKGLCDAAEGTVIVAHMQKGGQGRHGRVWESPPGNLYFSFVLTPDCKAIEIGQLSLLVGLALHRALSSFTDEALLLKWPNDVLLGGAQKKCAGILIDCDLVGDAVRSCIVGIGVNIAHAPDYAVSLDADLSADDVLQHFLAIFQEVYVSWKTDGFEAFREAWLGAAHKKGASLSVKIGERLESGAFHDIDALGNAILRMEDGSFKTISSGDVFLGGV